MNLLSMKNQIKEDVLESMYDYMESLDDDEDFDDVNYTKADIQQCGSLLENFITQLSTALNDKPKIIAFVKDLILSLNRLNDSVDGMLIETEQREDICLFILNAVNAAGLNTDEDLTEEWREW